MYLDAESGLEGWVHGIILSCLWALNTDAGRCIHAVGCWKYGGEEESKERKGRRGGIHRVDTHESPSSPSRF